MIENLGGIHGFLDFEIRCRKSTGVKNSTELMTDDAVDKLFRRKIGYLELVNTEVI